MIKKFFSAIALACLLVLGANVCSAGSFQTIYTSENFSATLKNDQSIDETFNTNDGKIRLQFRRLINTSVDKRMHAIIWLNDERIFDEHFPDVYPAYTFRTFKDTSNSRLFFVIQSSERAQMLGYSPAAKKMEVYIDSQNYYCEFSGSPKIVTTKGGDLILAFENSDASLSARYLFSWDEQKQWFGYRSLGTYHYSINRDTQY